MPRKTYNDRHTLTILWRIKNFPLWESDCDGREIKSPDLRPEVFKRKNNGKVLLILFRTGQCRENRVLYFSLIRQSQCPIDCEVSFVGRYSSRIIIGNATNCREKVLQVAVSSAMKIEVMEFQRSIFLQDDTLTLQCRFWKSLGHFPGAEFISIQTGIEISNASFEWPIREFSALGLNEEVNTIVRFEFFNLTNVFLLKFSLKGESLKMANACLELVPVSLRSIALRVFLKVSVSTNGVKCMNSVNMIPRYKSCKATEPCTCTPKLVIPIFTIATREELLQEESFVINDVLNLLCELPFIRTISIIDKHSYEFDNLKVKILYTWNNLSETSKPLRVDSSDTCFKGRDSFKSLGDELLNLYSEGNGADIVLRSGKFSMNVRKSVLSARSTLFRALFGSNIGERILNSIDFPDLDAQTLKGMLVFMYFGSAVCLEWENAIKLYYAANQYQVQSLKRECYSFFRSVINVKNASEILSLAHRYDDSELKSLVYDTGLGYYHEFSNPPE